MLELVDWPGIHSKKLSQNTKQNKLTPNKQTNKQDWRDGLVGKELAIQVWGLGLDPQLPH